MMKNKISQNQFCFSMIFIAWKKNCPFCMGDDSRRKFSISVGTLQSDSLGGAAGFQLSAIIVVNLLQWLFTIRYALV
jgi:hypothetical protein